MPERVTFTKKSADRIAKVVKRVESMPSAEPVQQRRRAGGYRMESLWEVTAVQTTEKTVTLKRVQDTDDNLNDRSETLEVAYDPDNEPAVEDRGMIIRLGDGTRFFFKRGAAINRVWVKEYCYVKSDVPAGTFGYPDEANIFSDGSASQFWVGIFKFESRIPADLTVATRAILHLAEQPEGYEFDTFTKNVVHNIQVRTIMEDFDPSTYTMNDYNAASSTGLFANEQAHDWSNNQVIHNIGQIKDPRSPVDIGGWTFAMEPGVPPIPLSMSGRLRAFENAYGFGVGIVLSAFNVGQLRTIKTEGNPYWSYLEWFER